MSDDGQRHALIVAVSDYQEPKLRRLRAPAADAERLAAVLRDPDIGNFDIELSLNEDEPALSRRIARFFSNRRPADLLLLHFSCHGVKDDTGELHLATTDTEMGDLLGVTSISSSWLSTQIERTRSKRIVVLLDCCFSGSFPFGVRARAGTHIDVRGALEGRGRAVITASSAMEYAYEGDEFSGAGQPSIFTNAVIDALSTGKADRDQDHRISIEELYDYVFDDVKERTPNQTPQMLSSLEGPLYVARSAYVAPIEAAQLDAQLVQLAESTLAGARLGAVAELSRLLDVSDPAIVLAAREQLERLRNDDSQQVSRAAQAVLDPGPEKEAPSTAAPPAAAPPTTTLEVTTTPAPITLPAPAPPAPAPTTTEPTVTAPPTTAPPDPLAPGPETTARPPVAPVPARWGTRVVATAIDLLFAFLCGCLPALVWAIPFPNNAPAAVGFAYFATAIAVGGVAYAAAFARQSGRTFGKRAISLAVVRLNGTVPDQEQVMQREAWKWIVVGLSVFFGLGLSLVLVAIKVRRREDRRPFYDIRAGTTVVRMARPRRR